MTNPLGDLGGVWGFAAVGAVVAAVAGMWDKITAVGRRVVGLFVQRVEIPSQPAHDAVAAHLVAAYPRSRNYDRMYGAWWEYQRDGRFGLIPYEQFGHRSLILWNGWFPFLFTNQQEQKKTGTAAPAEQQTATKVYSSLTFLRGTLDADALIREACARRNRLSWAAEDDQEENKARFVIHHVPKRPEAEGEADDGGNGLAWYQQGTCRLLAHTPDQLGKRPTTAGKALDNLLFPRRVKDLIKEIGLWRKSRDWYRGKGIPWKRGWLLYGPPGTGKTALARAFAEDMNLPIYVYNLAEMGNHELMRAWGEMQMNVPCIALIEDIDNVFHGRENVARKNAGFPMMMAAPAKPDGDGDGNRGLLAPPLTFDCLLNCLDGVERADGVFTIVTTNDIGKIDPALGRPRRLPDGSVEFISTRPGRIDKAVELGFMEVADKKKMAARILGAYEGEYLEMLGFIDRFPDLEETPAQFQERCAQLALRCFWREQEATVAPSVRPAAQPSLNGSHPVGAG